jgi:hypothetical protein
MLRDDVFVEKAVPLAQGEGRPQGSPVANPAAPHHVHGGPSRNRAPKIEENVICIIYNILIILIEVVS